jgi:diacylglycerol kinase family enzyme
VIVNAGSGHDEARLRCATIEDVLSEAGRTCHMELVDDPAELDAVAQRMATLAQANHGVLVAAGGDGTINAVAHQAVLQGCTFAVLPQGTFNYFGRTHHIPEDLAEGVRALLDARMKHVQIGTVNGRIFLVNASVGLYPRLLEEREHDKRQFGRSRIVALYSAIKTLLLPHRHLRITLELEGEEHSIKTTTLFVGNNRLQMEQIGLEPLSEAMEEGQLVAIAPKPASRFGLFGLLVQGLLGRLGASRQVVAFAFRSMSVRTSRFSRKHRIKVATDGEICKLPVPLEFRVLEGRLALLVPHAAGGAPASSPPTPSRQAM